MSCSQARQASLWHSLVDPHHAPREPAGVVLPNGVQGWSWSELGPLPSLESEIFPHTQSPETNFWLRCMFGIETGPLAQELAFLPRLEGPG